MKLLFKTSWILPGLLLLCVSFPVHAVENVILRLHGSNTVGAELGPELVKAWMSDSGYKDIRTKVTQPEEMLIHGIDKSGQSVAVEIHAHGSSTAFKDLKARKTDVGMASRPIKDKEVHMMASAQLRSLQGETVVALDGIAVVVHPDNPINRIDKQILRRIFNGEITQWSEVDPRLKGRIQVYARDDKSGTYDTFKSLVLGKKKPLVSSARRYESNADLSDDVSRDRTGIGFVGLPYIRNSKALSVSDGGVGILPKAFSVATEDYALSRRLFLYLPVYNENPYASQFIEFAQSHNAQAIVEKVGFVDQAIKSYGVEDLSIYPEEMREMIKGAERLSVNIRFQKGSIKLDNKAQKDIDRLVDYMAGPGAGRKLMLFGFSDGMEVMPIYSIELSVSRADRVSEILLRNGLAPVRVRGYGEAMQLAGNEDKAGEFKNRRVEIWLLP